jgi:hypothetical protein
MVAGREAPGWMRTGAMAAQRKVKTAVVRPSCVGMTGTPLAHRAQTTMFRTVAASSMADGKGKPTDVIRATYATAPSGLNRLLQKYRISYLSSLFQGAQVPGLARYLSTASTVLSGK